MHAVVSFHGIHNISILSSCVFIQYSLCLHHYFLLCNESILPPQCRGIRENYRESAYIGAALGLVLPLWLAWTLAGLVLPPSLQPACLGFGLVATATIIFVVMFIPRVSRSSLWNIWDSSDFPCINCSLENLLRFSTFEGRLVNFICKCVFVGV